MTGVVSRRNGPRLAVRVPQSYLAERQYVLDVALREWLGFDYDVAFTEGSHVVIQLVGDPGARTITLPDVLFACPQGEWLKEASMPVRPLARLVPDALPHSSAQAPADRSTARPVPVLFGEVGPDGRAWHETTDGLAISVDIFGSVFFLLTRYEEIVRRDRDSHDRFPASASLAAIEGFLDRPIVDEYIDLLWIAMQSQWPALERRPSTFRLRLTHDVDLPWAALAHRALAGDLVRRRDPMLAVRRARAFIDARGGRVDRDPFNTFDFLMGTSEREGLRSTFYFRAGGVGGRSTAMYRLSDRPVAGLLRRVHDRGHEVGLHGSHQSYRSPERTRAEFEELKDACLANGFDQPQWGVRQHFLRLANPQTWQGQEAAGLDHDSSLGFPDQIGFRAGTCREYPLFDLLAGRTLRLRERPLLVMDVTLFGYMRLHMDEAASRARAIAGLCRRHGGDAVILYHNDSLWDGRQRAHYRELVEDIVRG